MAPIGAVLSTWQHVVRRRELKREVRVTLFTELVNVDAGLKHALFAQAVNAGQRPVTLHAPEFLLSGYAYTNAWDPEVSFPLELTEGGECTVWVHAETLASGLEHNGVIEEVALTVRLRDATGGIY